MYNYFKILLAFGFVFLLQKSEAQVDSFFSIDNFESSFEFETQNGYYQKGVKVLMEDWKYLKKLSQDEAIICKEIKKKKEQLLFCNCALIDKSLNPRFEKYQLLYTEAVKNLLFGTEEPYSIYEEDNLIAGIQDHKIKGNGFYLLDKRGKKLTEKVFLEFNSDQQIDLGNGKLGFIAKCSKKLPPLQSSDKLSSAESQDYSWDLISEDGEIIFESYQELTDLVYGHSSVKKSSGIEFLPKYLAEKETDGSFIIRNTAGKFLIHALEITGLTEKNNSSNPSKSYIAINTHNNAFIVSQFDLNKKLFSADSFKINYPVSEKYLVFYEDAKAGLLDYNLKVTVPAIYREIDILNSRNHFIATQKDGSTIVIDASNNLLSKPQGLIFEDLSLMEDGRLLLLKDNKFGLCNMAGQMMIPFAYDTLKWAYALDNYYFIAGKSSPLKGNSLIDLNGKTVIDFGPYDIVLKPGNLESEDVAVLKYFDKQRSDTVVNLKN